MHSVLKRFVLVQIVLFAMCVSSHGDVVLVDLSNANADPTGTWNTIGTLNSTTSGLESAIGATPIDVVTSGWGGQNAAGNNWNHGTVDWVQEVAAEDSFFDLSDTPSSISFNNLPGTSYRVEVLSTWNANYIQDIQIGGAFADANFLGLASGTFGNQQNGDNWNAAQQGRGAQFSPNPEQGNWLIWNAVNPVGGTLTIDWLDDPGQSNVNIASAIRLQGDFNAVPEPSSLALVGLSAVGVGLVHRRKRRVAKSQKQ